MHSDEIAAGEYGTLGDSIEKEAAKLSRIICRHNAEMQALMTYLIREILQGVRRNLLYCFWWQVYLCHR